MIEKGWNLVLRSTLVALLCLAVAASVSSATPEAPSANKSEQKEDLPNFHQVHPYLYRSGEPTLEGLKQAKDKHGVKTVIDLRGSAKQTAEEATMAESLGLKYINLPMSAEPPTSRQIDTLMSEIRAARDGTAPGNVLVHCAHGSDRTGCMIGIWRVSEDGWNYDKTYQEMRKYWFGPKFVKLSGAVRQAYERRVAREKTGAATRVAGD